MISLALALVSPAHAACTITPAPVPADGARVTEAPRFFWQGDCTEYSVEFSTDASFVSHSGPASPLRAVRTWKPSDFRWENMLDRGLDPVAYWRVIGVDGTGAPSFSSTQMLVTDWDDDQDGSSFRDGDCDDGDATVFPGADDVPGDGVDSDCDGNGDGFCNAPTDVVSEGTGFEGSNVDASDVWDPSCAANPEGPDHQIEFTASVAGVYAFETSADFDTTVAILETCDGDELGCNDDGGEGTRSLAFVPLAAGQTVVVSVSGYGGATGAFVLDVNLAPALEDDCADTTDDDNDGATDCDDTDCAGLPECIETDCADGSDNDGDFDFDCEDSDCDGVGLCGAEICDDAFDNDGDFAEDCSDDDCALDAACAETVCDDGIDDNGNFDTDCEDASCFADAACIPAVCPTGVWSFGFPGSTAGTTAGGDDNWLAAPCGSSSGAPDVSYEFTAPTDGLYTFSTAGSTFDTILHVEPGCALSVDAVCNDDTNGLQSEVSVQLSAGETVVVVVDGFAANSGAYTLSVE